MALVTRMTKRRPMQRNLVVAGDLIAASRAAAFTFNTTDAVLNTGVEVAIFTLRGLSGHLIGGTLSHDLHLITAGCDAGSVRVVRVALGSSRALYGREIEFQRTGRAGVFL